VKVFFDNNLSPTLAATINGFLQHADSSAAHIRDLPCGRDASDVAWIEMLSHEAEDWIVITGDLRIQKNRAERLAFRNARLRGFVLAPGFAKMATNQVASFLLWRWPEVEQLVKLTRAPFLFEVPVSRNAQMRSLPL
jgi:hypothetical protein